MAEVATSGTVEFMTELLRRNEYTSIPLQLNNNVQDALNLLEFIIYVSTNLFIQYHIKLALTTAYRLRLAPPRGKS
jgi:hypothetical protein